MYTVKLTQLVFQCDDESMYIFITQYAKYCDILNITALISVTFPHVYEIKILKIFSLMNFCV